MDNHWFLYTTYFYFVVKIWWPPQSSSTLLVDSRYTAVFAQRKMNSVKKIQSEKGKLILIVNEYKYSLKKFLQ